MISIDEPPLAIVTCSRYLNSNGDFDVLIQLLFDEYTNSEQVIQHIQILPKLKELDSITGDVIDQDSFSIIIETVQYKVITNNYN